MALQVELVSPERILFSGEAEMVVARTSEGDIAFLTGHAPFLGLLGIGPVTIRLTGGSEEHAAVHGGFVQVHDDRVTILSEVAELAGQIDASRARKAKERAERPDPEVDPGEAEAARRRADARLEVASRA